MLMMDTKKDRMANVTKRRFVFGCLCLAALAVLLVTLVMDNDDDVDSDDGGRRAP